MEPIPLKPKSSIRASRGRATRLARNHFWFWIIALGSLALLSWLVSDALIPFIVALAVAYFLHPTVDWLQRRGLGAGLAAGISILVFVGILAGVLMTIMPPLWDQLSRLAAAGPEILARATAMVRSVTDQYILPAVPVSVPRPVPVPAPAAAPAAPSVGEHIQNLAPIAGQVVGGGLLIAHLSFVLLLIPLIAFYLLRDWGRILDFIDVNLPRRYIGLIRAEAREVDRVLDGFVRGQTVMCGVLAAYYSIGLFAVGLEFSLAIGTVTGLLSFIPYVGTFTGLAIALASGLVQQGGGAALIIGIGAVFAGAQVIEVMILHPLLIGPSVRLHPAWLIFGLLVCGSLFGWIGAFLAVPLFAVIGVVARFALRRYRSSDYFSGANADVPVTTEPPRT